MNEWLVQLSSPAGVSFAVASLVAELLQICMAQTTPVFPLKTKGSRV